MEITIRPTSIEDAEALVELYSQPKAQRETLQLPKPSKLIETVTELADNWLNVRRIQIEVNVDNEKAISLYKKHGFVIEGEAVDSSFREGRFINTYYMARINPNAL